MPRRHRLCDVSCNIPFNWGIRLYESLSKIDETLSIEELQVAIIEFEYCKSCSKNTEFCNKKNNCTDYIKFLLNLSPHYQKIRTIIRRVYEIRSLNNMLLTINNVIKNGSIKQLESLLSEASMSTKSDLSLSNSGYSENQLLNKNKTMIQKFKKELISKMDVIECGCCHQMLPRKEFKIIEKFEVTGNNILIKLLSEEKSKLPLSVCKSNCYKSILENKIPKFSVLNNMKLSQLPPEIEVLNNYEFLLIQLAKCFHSIYRLESVSKYKKNEQAFGFRGIKVFNI